MEAIRSAYIQCVVALRPSSTPAAASTNEPLQTLSSQAPRAAAWRTTSSTRSSIRGQYSLGVGETTTRSAS